MKYFTKKLWSEFNKAFLNDKKYNLLSKQWNKNRTIYWNYIKSIEGKLPKQARIFFPKTSLHDGSLVRFSFGDKFSKKIDRASSIGTFAEFNILSFDGKFEYHLKYQKIRKCVIDYPSDFPLFLNDQNSFGDWGYDEFTLLKGNWMKHEILFSTGMVICLEFKDFSYKKSRVNLPNK